MQQVGWNARRDVARPGVVAYVKVMGTGVATTIAIASLALTANACGGAQRAAPTAAGEPEAPTTQVDDEAESGQLRAELKGAIDGLDRELKTLGDALEEATADARERLELEKKTLQERRDKLAKALRALEATANEKGRAVRDEIQGLLRDLGLRAGEPRE